MEEEEIKSAFELAMERISGLPELTPEEKAEQKERECSPIGAAMAVKYMDGTLADTELPIELKRYDGSRQQIVRRALISSLCREMNFESSEETALKALRGIMQIAPEKKDFLEKAEGIFLQIVGEFEEDKKKRLVEFSASLMERIKGLGISGSAVSPNLDESEQWGEELGRLQRTYEPRLGNLRDMLTKEFNSKTQRLEDLKS